MWMLSILCWHHGPVCARPTDLAQVSGSNPIQYDTSHLRQHVARPGSQGSQGCDDLRESEVPVRGPGRLSARLHPGPVCPRERTFRLAKTDVCLRVGPGRAIRRKLKYLCQPRTKYRIEKKCCCGFVFCFGFC